MCDSYAASAQITNFRKMRHVVCSLLCEFAVGIQYIKLIMILLQENRQN